MLLGRIIGRVGGEVRVALRALVKQPAFALSVTASLALGIGAATALFSVINAVFLRPLPFRHADRTVAVSELESNSGVGAVEVPTAFPTLRLWRDESRTMSELAGTQRRTLMLTQEGRTEAVFVGVATANVFPMLGIPAKIGRTFTSDEDRPGAEPVALLSERTLLRRFGGDSGIIGRQIRVGDTWCTVVGIVGHVEIPTVGAPEVWLPVSIGLTSHSQAGHTAHGGAGAHAGHAGHELSLFDDPSQRVLTVIGQLAPAASPEQARFELETIAARVPGAASGERKVIVTPLERIVRSRVERPLTALVLASSLIFLIACTNAISLVLTRLIGRRFELGLRVALGCGRARFAWHALTETMLLLAAAASAGWLLASWLLAVLVRTGPVPLPRRAEVSLDGAALAFAIAVTALTAVLVVLLPLAVTARSAPQEWLRGTTSRTATTDRRQRRFRSTLLGAEIALSVALLIGVGLALRSFWKLSSVKLGYQSADVLVARVDPPSSLTPEGLRAFYQEVVTRIEALPGVEAAGATGDFPLHTSYWTTAFRINNDPWPKDRSVTTNYARVMGDYFGAMRIALKQGRLFMSTDGADGMKVAVVNETFAKRFLPERGAIGARLQFSEQDPFYEVVGIVADTVQRQLNVAPSPHFYVPYVQNPRGSMTLAVRAAIPAPALAASVQAAVTAVSTSAPMSRVGPVDRLIAEAIAPERYMALLLSVVGGIAALLVVVGVYGLTAHSVQRRTPEIGIRLTLGATPASAVRLVIRQCLGVVAVGVVFGLGAAVLLSATIRGMLFGIDVTDYVTFTAIPLMVVAVSALAAYGPARRASRIDPLSALRSE